MLISKLTQPRILAYPDFAEPFILHIDASGSGLGAALYQTQDGKQRVIAYGSRTLSAAERNYCAYRRELLALKWSVTEKFHDYLYGRRFHILTDNNPLISSCYYCPKLNPTDHRWLASLAPYDFTITYRAGKSNADADGLSRLPFMNSQADVHEDADAACVRPFLDRLRPLAESQTKGFCSSRSFEAILQCHQVMVPAVEVIPASEAAVDDMLEPAVDVRSSNGRFPTISAAEWPMLQNDDSHICRVVGILLGSQQWPVNLYDESIEVRQMLQERSRLFLKDNVLYRVRKMETGEQEQLVLPYRLRGKDLHGLHGDVGHLGIERTLDLARSRFYWPGIAKDIKVHISRCESCIKRKSSSSKAPMVPISTTEPLELLAIDFLTLEKGKGGFENILVVTDSFTKYSWAFPTRNQRANTVASVLWEKVISNYGFPQRLHSDQGQDFESKVISDLCKMAKIDKTRTTPYHPQGNGQTERFNRALLDMLGTLNDDKKHSWPEYVSPLVHAYNCTKHSTTGYAPYFLMFGRKPRLPIDVHFGIENLSEAKPYCVYVDNLRQRLSYAFDRAGEATKKRAAINKRNYDVNARDSCLYPGDRVLVRNLNIRGKHKLSNRWEDHIHRVIEKVNDLPVYKVKSEKTGRLRVLHRNPLLPVSTIEEDSMHTTLENSHDFYQIDPEEESAPDHGANYEETEITAKCRTVQ